MAWGMRACVHMCICAWVHEHVHMRKIVNARRCALDCWRAVRLLVLHFDPYYDLANGSGLADLHCGWMGCSNRPTVGCLCDRRCFLDCLPRKLHGVCDLAFPRVQVSHREQERPRVPLSLAILQHCRPPAPPAPPCPAPPARPPSIIIDQSFAGTSGPESRCRCPATDDYKNVSPTITKMHHRQLPKCTTDDYQNAPPTITKMHHRRLQKCATDDYEKCHTAEMAIACRPSASSARPFLMPVAPDLA